MNEPEMFNLELDISIKEEICQYFVYLLRFFLH